MSTDVAVMASQPTRGGRVGQADTARPAIGAYDVTRVDPVRVGLGIPRPPSGSLGLPFAGASADLAGWYWEREAYLIQLRRAPDRAQEIERIVHVGYRVKDLEEYLINVGGGA